MANADTAIRGKVQEFVKAEKLFTSVDIGNAVKKDGGKIRNRDVAHWLRSHSKEAGLFDNYDTEVIDVLNGAKKATLYRPCWQTSDNYDTRNLAALKPGDVKNFQRVLGVPMSASASPATIAQSAQAAQAAAPASSAKKTRKIDGNVTVIRSKRRIKISAFLVKKLGWKPGEKVDTTKIETTTPITKTLYVNADNRVSIPRSTVDWGTDPVKVFIDNGKVRFEKA